MCTAIPRGPFPIEAASSLLHLITMTDQRGTGEDPRLLPVEPICDHVGDGISKRYPRSSRVGIWLTYARDLQRGTVSLERAG